MSFGAITDAANATQRLYGVFEAETLTETLVIDEALKPALEVKNATFTWDAPPPDAVEKKKSKRNHKDKSKGPALSVPDADKDQENPFHITNISMSVPRGKLVAIVGAVGCGKTSLLQGIIGEMRRTSGSVKFGASVGYCPQNAWIQNATIRDNICFGRPFEEARYWNAIRDSCLEPDLEMLPNGDLTEVGEKVCGFQF